MQISTQNVLLALEQSQKQSLAVSGIRASSTKKTHVRRKYIYFIVCLYSSAVASQPVTSQLNLPFRHCFTSLRYLAVDSSLFAYSDTDKRGVVVYFSLLSFSSASLLSPLNAPVSLIAVPRRTMQAFKIKACKDICIPYIQFNKG